MIKKIIYTFVCRRDPIIGSMVQPQAFFIIKCTIYYVKVYKNNNAPMDDGRVCSMYILIYRGFH